jgi:hypothetical protein
VHFVDAEYDTGPILAQRVVPVYPTDTPKQLAARVLEQVCGGVVCGGVVWQDDATHCCALVLCSNWPVCQPHSLSKPACLGVCVPWAPGLQAGSARPSVLLTRTVTESQPLHLHVCPVAVPLSLQEHQVYPYAVSALVDGRITFREDGIPIIWEAR